MNFQEIMTADIARYEEEERQLLCKSADSENVKTNIDSRRSRLIGEIMLAHFPELNCFQPKLNKAANKCEFEPFENFLNVLSKSKVFQKNLKKIVEDKQAKCEIYKSQSDM